MTCAWDKTYNLIPNLNVGYKILDTNELQNINDRRSTKWPSNNKNISERLDLFIWIIVKLTCLRNLALMHILITFTTNNWNRGYWLNSGPWIRIGALIRGRFQTKKSYRKYDHNSVMTSRHIWAGRFTLNYDPWPYKRALRDHPAHWRGMCEGEWIVPLSNLPPIGNKCVKANCHPPLLNEQFYMTSF